MEADHAQELAALRQRDPEALARLFEAHGDRVYRLALGLLGDAAAAEDVVQQTFLTAIARLEDFEGRASLGTWLHRVAYNASIDILRKQREVGLPDDESEDGEAPTILPRSFLSWDLSPEEMLEDGEARRILDEAITTLPDTLRAAFILRDIEGLSTEEASQVLGLSVSATKVRLHRARMLLREKLADYFVERSTRQGRIA